MRQRDRHAWHEYDCCLYIFINRRDQKYMSHLFKKYFSPLVPPMLSIPNQLEAAYIGQDVTLECHTEAYPSSINYWTTDRGDMIISGRYAYY